jgi:hypothetical protein
MAIRCFPVSMTRLALRPFTFSNGVTVPAGTLISIPAFRSEIIVGARENPTGWRSRTGQHSQSNLAMES